MVVGCDVEYGNYLLFGKRTGRYRYNINREYSEKSRNNSQKRILQFNYAKSGRVRRKTTQIIIPRALARTFLLSTLPTKITGNLLSTQGEMRMNESC